MITSKLGSKENRGIIRDCVMQVDFEIIKSHSITYTIIVISHSKTCSKVYLNCKLDSRSTKIWASKTVMKKTFGYMTCDVQSKFYSTKSDESRRTTPCGARSQ